MTDEEGVMTVVSGPAMLEDSRRGFEDRSYVYKVSSSGLRSA